MLENIEALQTTNARGFILTKKITVAFHILQSYDSHLIFQELERYTVFTRKSVYAQKSAPL